MIASVKPPPALKRRVLSPKQILQPKLVLGEAGEKLALNFLIGKDYQPMATNVMVGQHEVDLVMIDPSGDELVFVEVKTRSDGQFGHPAQGLNYRQRHSLRRLAGELVARWQWPGSFRLDMVTVEAGRVEHFENISW